MPPALTESRATPRVLIGTSGWHYPHWRSVFYPEGLAPGSWFAFYAARFPCVELNSSFYRLPTAAAIGAWVERAPPGFRFAVKASRSITHYRKLGNCQHLLQSLFARLALFGSKLGPVLFQFPPRWGFDQQRLKGFLACLPRHLRVVCEFRDPSWQVPEVYTLLAEHAVASCGFDLAGEYRPPQPVTEFVYLRLHGPRAAYRGSYCQAALAAWADRIRGWRSQGLDVYLFFDNDEAGHAAANARALLGLLGEGRAV